MKQKIIFSRIIKAQLQELTPNNQKNKLLGVLVGDVFYNLTNDIEERTNENTIQKIIKKSDIINNPLTEKPMQIIFSWKDLEDLRK
jgi:hypothetical protein